MDKGYLNFNADITDDLYPLHFGIKQCQPSEQCGPMIRDHYLIHYIIKGQGVFYNKENRYTLKAGDFFVIYPDDINTYCADENEPWFFCWISFNGRKAEEYCRKLITNQSSAVGKTDGEPLVNCLNECIDYAQNSNGTPSQLRLSGYLYEALSFLENEKSNTHSCKKLINAAILYMNCNCEKKILATDVADFLGFEYSYFYRIFKEETGITPKKYLINIRIEKSKKLIREGYSFKEIPNMIGISSVYSFTKMFKQTTNMTPSEYRKRISASSVKQLP